MVTMKAAPIQGEAASTEAKRAACATCTHPENDCYTGPLASHEYESEGYDDLRSLMRREREGGEGPTQYHSHF